MRFLLTALNAKYIHSNPAVYSLKSYAGKWSEHVEIAEYTINNRVEDILEDIYNRKPDAIGFSCYIWNWDMVQDVVVELHKLCPDLPIYLGGPEVSFDAEQILEDYPMVRGVMVGEGEETFCELLQHHVGEGIALADIAGLVVRGGKMSPRSPLSMSEIPFLYEDMAPFENRIIYYESQRGCPFRCSYCLSSIDKTVRFRDMSVIKKELQFFLDHSVKQVKFVDRTFNCNHEHAMAIWKYISENDNGVTNFHFEVAGDIVNEEEIALLQSMRPGLVQLEIGVQSTNPETLKEIRRVMDLTKLKKVTDAIRCGGNIHQHLDLIAGLPFEDYESFGKSFNEVYAMKPNQLQLGFLKVLKGSYMHEMAGEYGLVYTKKAPYEVLYTKWLPYEKVRRLKKIEEMVELYYNSGQFTHTLPILEKAFSTPFAMYEKLADFYEEKGYFTEAPARMYRYGILLEFAMEYDGQRESLYKEVLTYDAYLRENLKSRPDFAKDLSLYKGEMTAFYKQEEQERNYLAEYTEYDSRQLARMTHIEAFRYAVWEQDAGAEHADEKVKGYVLFDYKKRDPLTFEARTQIITPERIEEAVRWLEESKKVH